MTVKDLVLYHLEHTFEKEVFGSPSLSMAIEGLGVDQATWKPAPPRHSVWQIVRHVTLWKQGVLESWDGRKPDYDEMERTDWQDVAGDERSWQADVQALHRVSMRLKERLSALDDAALYQAFEGEEMLTALRILRMATHDIYHAGQIQYIRALQKG